MRSLYRNHKWVEFSNKVKERDGYACTSCGKKHYETTLQVHHTFYRGKLKPWEYPFSDCLTLCKGCHAKEHGLIEPTSGWVLLGVDDLGDLSGECQKRGCGNSIRYANYIYHPKWGEMTVGSTCVEYLTQEDQAISKEVINLYKDVGKFIDSVFWIRGKTKKGFDFKYTTCRVNRLEYQIRVFSRNDKHSYQIVRRGKPLETISTAKCSTDILALELGCVHLRAMFSFGQELQMYRDVYSNLLKVNS